MLTPRFFTYLLLLFATSFIGIVRFKKLAPSIRLLGILVWITCASEIFTRLFSISWGTGIPVYHVFIPLQILVYTGIYYLLLARCFKLKIVILSFSILTFILTLCNTLFLQGLYSFPSYSTSLISLMIVVFSLMSLFNMLKHPVNMSLMKQPVFWLNFGNLLFYPVTFFIFGLFNPFLKIFIVLPEWQYILIWTMNMILYGSYFMALKTGVKKSID